MTLGEILGGLKSGREFDYRKDVGDNGQFVSPEQSGTYKDIENMTNLALSAGPGAVENKLTSQGLKDMIEEALLRRAKNFNKIEVPKSYLNPQQTSGIESVPFYKSYGSGAIQRAPMAE